MLTGSLSGDVKQGWGGVGKTNCFLALCVNISKTVGDIVQSYY